jgi:hypothetical protein
MMCPPNPSIERTVDSRLRRLSMKTFTTRRLLVVFLGFPWLPARSSEESPSLRRWLVGNWQSDAERTMQYFHFQGRRLTPEQSEKVSRLFGHLRYHITSSEFRVVEGRRTLRVSYVVASETDSTITLSFPRRKDMPELTLYRVSSDVLFIRAGNNFEYFHRTAA